MYQHIETRIQNLIMQGAHIISPEGAAVAWP